MSFQMTEEELKLLSDHVRGYCGLVIHPSQGALFQKRVGRRVHAKRLATAREYYNFLRFDPAGGDEMRELVNALTVNETYFFREAPQMGMFSRALLPRLKERKRGQKFVRIWSSACSNGAEPYSLAILVLESGLLAEPGWRVEICATDINSEMVGAARKGHFAATHFRATPPEILKKYFVERAPGTWELADRVRKMVSFSQLNLHNATQVRLMPKMDLIFCRNALIYFDDAGKKVVVETLYDTLADFGYLVTGQSESLFKITTLYEITPMEGAIVYQRSGPKGGPVGTERGE